MPLANVDLIAFNRGIVSPKALARTDVERTRLSAAVMNNWLGKTQGAMTIRPGTKYLGSSKSDQSAQWIEFVASSAQADKALLELTPSVMRVWINDTLLSRTSVATTISNSTFATSTGWTDGSTSGGTLTFGGSGLVLNAVNIGGLAKCTRQVSVAGPDHNVEHGLAIHVTRGPVTFRCGSAAGLDDYVAETTLGTGYHSLAVTPTGDIFLTIQSDVDVDRIVASLAIETAGTVEVTTPWTSADIIATIRTDQSADVTYVASSVQQQKIERRGTGRSWSVVKYAPDNGPFMVNQPSKARLKPGSYNGNTTLTSDINYFTSGHVGALFRAFHDIQSGIYSLGREDTYTSVWRVTGVGSTTERRTTYTVTGTWVGTVTFQRSFISETEGFHDFGATTINVAGTIDDTSDNLTVWYRAGIKNGNYTSGTAVVSLAYFGGGDTGVCRVTGYTSPTQVSIEVLQRFQVAQFTSDWSESEWSTERGFPSTGQLYEGRLWFGGGSKVWGSVSDDYENFDDNTEGDSAPIARSLGKGPVDAITFMLGALRLLLGNASAVLTIRSSTTDEPLTATNATAKSITTQGSADLRAILIDTRGVFVHRTGQRLYILGYDWNSYDYTATDLSKLVPDLLVEGIVSLAVQRFPDTRIHCVLGDGTVAILTYDDVEEVICWSTWSTDGIVEQAMSLPGAGEDQVYYHIKRTINGSTKRYLERWADEADCVGGTQCWLADCAVSFTGPSATITGASHLEAKSVILWGDGTDLSPDVAGAQTTYAVSGGQFTAPQSVTSGVVGLPYDADYETTKLAYAAALGTALTQKKRVDHIGLILYKTHVNGIYFGSDEDNLDQLPRMIDDGAQVSENKIFETFDMDAFPFPGKIDTDSRIWLKARAPRPCTVLAAIPSIETTDKP